jgi:hypothetical protein
MNTHKIFSAAAAISMVLASGCAADGTTTSTTGTAGDGDGDVPIWLATPENNETADVPVTPVHTPHSVAVERCHQLLLGRTFIADNDPVRVEDALWRAVECHADANDAVLGEFDPGLIQQLPFSWTYYRERTDALCQDLLEGRGSLDGYTAEARCALGSERLLSDLIGAYGALGKQPSVEMPTEPTQACSDHYFDAQFEYGDWSEAATDLVSCQAKLVDARLLEAAELTFEALDGVCIALSDQARDRRTLCRHSAAVSVARMVMEHR